MTQVKRLIENAQVNTNIVYLLCVFLKKMDRKKSREIKIMSINSIFILSVLLASISYAQSDKDFYLNEIKYTVTFNFEPNIQDDFYSNGQLAQKSYYNGKAYTDSIEKFFKEGSIALRAQLLSFEVDSSYGQFYYKASYSVQKYFRNGTIAFEGFYTDSLQCENYYLPSGELYFNSLKINDSLLIGVEKRYLDDTTESQVVFIKGKKILQLEINYQTGEIYEVIWIVKKPRKYDLLISEFDLSFYLNLEELKTKLRL